MDNTSGKNPIILDNFPSGNDMLNTVYSLDSKSLGSSSDELTGRCNNIGFTKIDYLIFNIKWNYYH